MASSSSTGLAFDKVLTTAEKRVVENLSRGLSENDISAVLGIPSSDLETTISSLKTKLNAFSPKTIVTKALNQGLIKKPSAWAKGATLPPHNPYTGPAGTSTMHANTASSDATLNPGPGLSGNYKIVSIPGWGENALNNAVFPYVVPTVLMPENGGLVCIGVGNTATNARIPSVLLLSPFSLEILDSQQLVKPESGNLAGGIYSYIDHNGSLVLVNGSGDLQWYECDYNMATDSGSITLIKSVNINQPMVVSLAPDYEGKIWFATQGSIDTSSPAAVVGFYDPNNGQIATFPLPAGEMVANSISSSPSGIAVATTEALYLFKQSKRKNDIEQLWRYEYDNSGYRKPGQLSPGTGATPVFFGPKTGFEYVAITDNGAADNGNTPAENFNIFTTRKLARGGSPLIAKIPFLSDLNSGTENAPIAVGGSVFSPSTYGYWYPPSAETPSSSTPSSFNQASFPGGAQRIDVTAGNTPQRSIWQSLWQNPNVKSVALPRLSIADEQIYTITANYSTNSRSNSTAQYYLATIDPITGNATNLAELGSNTWNGNTPDVAFLNSYSNNPLQMTGVISPEGVFYQGMASGIFSVEGAGPRFGIGLTTDGFSFSNHVSFDGNGNTYSIAAIGEGIQNGNLMWNGVEFQLGAANQFNFTWANGQDISVAQGSDLNVLNLAAAAIGGDSINENITIHFTDGTSTTWNQSFSDWQTADYNPGESIIAQQSYGNTSSGETNNKPNYIYGYSYAAPSGKVINSIVLPFAYNLRLLGLEMSASTEVNIATEPSTTTGATATNQLSSSVAIDPVSQRMGTAHSNQLAFPQSQATPYAWAGASFHMGAGTESESFASSSTLKCRGQMISLPSGEFKWLYLVGGASGTQTNQSLSLNHSDGSSSIIEQSFSDWHNGGVPPTHGSVNNESVQTWPFMPNQTTDKAHLAAPIKHFVYNYAIPISGLSLDSLTLPNNEHIEILGISLL